MSRTNGQLMDEALAAVIAAGEGPYQANRSAVYLLDVQSHVEEGREHLNEVLSGIDGFIRALEGVRNVSQNVVKNAVAAIH